MGDTKMRLGIVTERSVTGLKRRDMGVVPAVIREIPNLARPHARTSAALG